MPRTTKRNPNMPDWAEPCLWCKGDGTDHTIYIGMSFSYSDGRGKTCDACGEFKPHSEFGRKPSRYPEFHLQLSRDRCKACEKAKRHRPGWGASKQAKGPCRECNGNGYRVNGEVF